jgi:hypothetical protein
VAQSASNTAEISFCLASVDEVDAPEGSEGTWYRYVISQGDNSIVGMRCGARPEVMLFLDALLERLNTRFSKAAALPRAARGRPAKAAAKPAD